MGLKKSALVEIMDKLISFLPAFEVEGRKFGSWDVSKPEDKEMHLPYARYDKDVRDFFDHADTLCFAYRKNGIEIPSDWLDIPDCYETSNLELLIAVLTKWMRGERFNEGMWFEALRDGHIQRILRRMKVLRDEIK